MQLYIVHVCRFMFNVNLLCMKKGLHLEAFSFFSLLGKGISCSLSSFANLITSFAPLCFGSLRFYWDFGADADCRRAAGF